MDNKLTREQYDFLSSHSENMRLATEAGYIRGMRSSAIRAVEEIYQYAVPAAKKTLRRGCYDCVREQLKALYPIWLEWNGEEPAAPGPGEVGYPDVSVEAGPEVTPAAGPARQPKRRTGRAAVKPDEDGQEKAAEPGN